MSCRRSLHHCHLGVVTGEAAANTQVLVLCEQTLPFPWPTAPVQCWVACPVLQETAGRWLCRCAPHPPPTSHAPSPCVLATLAVVTFYLSHWDRRAVRPLVLLVGFPLLSLPLLVPPVRPVGECVAAGPLPLPFLGTAALQDGRDAVCLAVPAHCSVLGSLLATRVRRQLRTESAEAGRRGSQSGGPGLGTCVSTCGVT